MTRTEPPDFRDIPAIAPLGSEGIPYVLESFTVVGAYESLEKLGSEQWKPVAVGAETRRNAEFPASGGVILFDNY